MCMSRVAMVGVVAGVVLLSWGQAAHAQLDTPWFVNTWAGVATATADS